MLSQIIDDELKLGLVTHGSSIDKITLLLVPGLGTMGIRPPKRMRQTMSGLSYHNIEVNGASFIYRSHKTNIMDNFENDVEDLAEAVLAIEQQGIPREKIGLIGECYGSYISLQYLKQNQNIGFVIMIEPFLGLDYLNPFLRALSKGTKYFIPNMRVPCGRRFNKGWGYINIASFLRNADKGIDLERTRTPKLVFTVGAHSVFNTEEACNHLRENGAETYNLHKGVLKETKKQMYTAVADFLNRIYQVTTPDNIQPT